MFKDRCQKIIDILLSISLNERTNKMKIEYFYALNIICENERENIYDALKSMKNEIEAELTEEYLTVFANVCFNLEIYDEAIFYIKKAIEINSEDESLKEMLEIYDNA